MSDDFCLICAEPIQFAGVFQCGHTDVCSLCVTRMRLIMSDPKCLACQKPSENVFVTRHQGSFTAKYPHDLRSRIKDKTLFTMKACPEICFDDEEVRDEMDVKCALTCSVCYEQGNRMKFNSMKALKAHLKEMHGKFMCDVCLGGRQVFVNEQVLYTRSELNRHYKRGDTKGPMAEAGFKGHPTCQFCKKHFYSDQELYSHMQTKHLQCFLCKKARPNEYVYYKNLADLSNHFASAHHYCTHEDCKDKHPEERVFNSKEEFRVHYLQNHGESLSKNQRKQALQIDVNYGPMRGGQGHQGSRGGGGGGGGRGGSRRDESTSLRPQVPQVRREERRADDFPELGADVDYFAGMDSSETHWRRAAGGSYGRPLGSAGGSTSSAHHPHNQYSSAEDFPTLPGMSKSAKKRAKAKARAAAAVAHNRDQDSAWSQASASTAAVATPSSSQATEEDKAKNRLLMQRLRAELDSIVFNGFRQESARFLQGTATPTQYYSKIKALGLLDYAKDLAQLCPDRAKREELLKLVESDQAPRIGQRTDLASLLRKSKPSSSGSLAPPSAPSSGEDFPTLGGGPAPAPAPVTRPAQNFRAVVPRNPAPTPAPAPAPAPAQQPLSAAERRAARRAERERASAAAAAAVAERPFRPVAEERSAEANSNTARQNKMLMEKMRQEMSPEAFTGFRMQSMGYLKGQITVNEYYDLIVSVGLTEYVDSLAQLCPERAKREELMRLHRDSVMAASIAATMLGNGGGGSGSGEPSNRGKKKKGKKGKKQGLGAFLDSVPTTATNGDGAGWGSGSQLLSPQWRRP